MPPKFVDIFVWEVEGQADNYGPFLTGEEAKKANSNFCSGWGEVKQKTVKAQIACDHDCDSGCGPCSSH